MTTFDQKNALAPPPGQLQATPPNGNNYTTLTSPSVSRVLTVATVRLNDTIHNHVVTLASRHGSATEPSVCNVHFSNATARTVGLPKSDVTVINALPLEDCVRQIIAEADGRVVGLVARGVLTLNTAALPALEARP